MDSGNSKEKMINEFGLRYIMVGSYYSMGTVGYGAWACEPLSHLRKMHPYGIREQKIVQNLSRAFQIPLHPSLSAQLLNSIPQVEMDSKDHQQLHFVLVPITARGHLIPMTDMARLLAARGVVVTIVTTTLAASSVKTTIDRAVESGLRIRLFHLPFPCKEAGLPDGCETIDALPSGGMLKNYLAALDLLQNPVEHFLEQNEHIPNCIISDNSLKWTLDTARKFKIPRLVFHGMCCFSLLCRYNINHHNSHQNVTSDSEPFLVPDMPYKVEVTKAQLPAAFTLPPDMIQMREKITETEMASYGVVLNSYKELEPECIDSYQKATGKKAWAIGPVSLCNRDTSEKADRGYQASVNQTQCLNWLDSRKPKSVVYVCFGSMCNFSYSELIEMGLGLEASNQSFIWVIRNNEKSSKIEEWLEEGFEERVKDRGLIIRGWAPQILILSHPAVGGFVTHCGWNSTLESISAGLPMITWPLFAEQFFNEKLVVDVLRIGVSVGNKVGVLPWEERTTVETVKMEDVKKAVELLMAEGKEGEERRKRASEFGEKAKGSLEQGGSSFLNMTLLIEDIKAYARDNAFA